jgi:hypothetical protein
MSSIGDKIARRAERIYREVKSFALYGIAVVAGIWLLPIVSPYLSRPEVLAVVVAVLAIAIINLSRGAARKPPRPNKRFLKQLLHSEPITPQHNPQKAAGGKLTFGVTDEYRRFFADFAEFADIVNWWFAEEYVGGRWRLQELPDGDVRLNIDYSGGPIYGRCYTVFHNQVELGRLEIRPGHPYDDATPKVITEIELHSVRLLHYNTIAGFLSEIASYVCERNPGDGQYTNPNQAIVGAMTKALWGTQEITEFADLDGQDWGELECTFVGPATGWYFNRREALRRKRADASDLRAQVSTKEIVEQMSEAVSEALRKQPRRDAGSAL